MNFQFKTPPIPAAFHTIEHSGWCNIASFNLGNRHLFGNETLFGDWDGETLLMLQNFAPESYILDNIAKGVECPYRHGENVKTNSMLKAYLAPLLKSSDNIGCGVLCINAVYLINHGTSWSPSIPQALIKKSIPVVTFSLRNMPNLRRIICCGNVASRSWAILAAAEPELASSKVVFRVPHPAARISRDEKLRQWLEVTRFA